LSDKTENKSVLKSKSYDFALRIINLYKYLVESKKEFILSKQLLKSGTAVGALIREAEFAQSKKDFVSKMSIALKEANETNYWIDLLKDSKYLEKKEYESINDDVKELIKMLVSTIKTSKKNL